MSRYHWWSKVPRALQIGNTSIKRYLLVLVINHWTNRISVVHRRRITMRGCILRVVGTKQDRTHVVSCRWNCNNGAGCLCSLLHSRCKCKKEDLSDCLVVRKNCLPRRECNWDKHKSPSRTIVFPSEYLQCILVSAAAAYVSLIKPLRPPPLIILETNFSPPPTLITIRQRHAFFALKSRHWLMALTNGRRTFSQELLDLKSNLIDRICYIFRGTEMIGTWYR